MTSDPDRNVWVDISVVAAMMAGGPYAEQLAWVLCKAGTDRTLFGSDYPLDRPRAALGAVASPGFTADELDAILYGNAAALLG